MPFIRGHLEAYFPPSDDLVQKVQQIADLDKKDASRRKILQEQLDAAEQAAATVKKASLTNTKKMTRRCPRLTVIHSQSNEGIVVARLRDELRRLDEAKEERHKNQPTPPWIMAVREALPADSKMSKYVTAAAHLDMFTITQVLLYYLYDVFRAIIGGGRGTRVSAEGDDDGGACGDNDANDDGDDDHDEYYLEVEGALERMQRATHSCTLRPHTYFDSDKQMPTEVEVLDCLKLIQKIILLFKVSGGDERLKAVISHAQDLYDKSVYSGTNYRRPLCVEVEVTKNELATHFFYMSLIQFEAELARQVGTVHISENGYVAKDTSNWSRKRSKRFDSLKNQLKQIALARNKLARNLFANGEKNESDPLSILEMMGKILHYLQGLKHCLPITKWGELPDTWANHTVYHSLLDKVRDDKVKIQVKLTRSRSRMAVPIPPDDCFVGREECVRQITKSLMQRGARVLVHGPSGVGKTTLIAEVIRRCEANGLAGVNLMGWLTGGTKQSLQSELIELFNLYHPEVVRGLESKSDKCLEAVRKWFETHDDWLIVVDDTTSDTETLSRYILTNSSHGRVIVTSKEQLDKKVALKAPSIKTTLTLNLQPLSTTRCFEMWQAMRLFRVSTKELDQMSEHDNIEVELESRCNRTRDSPPLSAVAYVRPQPYETPRERKNRHRKIASALLEYECLSTPGLQFFFEKSLGNLPLSVRLVGNMLRNSGGECVVTGTSCMRCVWRVWINCVCVSVCLCVCVRACMCH